MSIRIMTQVWEDRRTASQSELVLLLAMADWADDNGFCWPSVTQLANKARLSDRAVQQILGRLIETQRIRLVKKGGTNGSKRTANKYQLVFQVPGERGTPGELALSGEFRAPGERGAPGSIPANTVHPVKEVHPIYPVNVVRRTGEGGAPVPVNMVHPIRYKETSINATTYKGSLEEEKPSSGPNGASSRFFLDLAEEFGLSSRQVAEVEQTAEVKGLEYVQEKAAIIRDGETRNAAAAFVTAIREDWRAPVTPKKPTKPKTVPEVPGWREWLIERGYPQKHRSFPVSYDEFRRTCGEHVQEFLREKQAQSAIVEVAP